MLFRNRNGIQLVKKQFQKVYFQGPNLDKIKAESSKTSSNSSTSSVVVSALASINLVIDTGPG